MWTVIALGMYLLGVGALILYVLVMNPRNKREGIYMAFLWPAVAMALIVLGLLWFLPLKISYYLGDKRSKKKK